jgi:hypothetical protein
MSRYYVHRDPGPREILGSLAIALGIGGLSFYLARALLSREGLESTPPSTTLSGAVIRHAPNPDGEG